MKLCYLSDLKLADRSSLIELYTHPTVRQYLGGPLQQAVAEKRATEDIQNLAALPIWSIRSLSHDSFIGIISLDDHHDGEDIEVSYVLLPEYWGKGYATQALKLVLAYAFKSLNLEKIIAETQTQNTASIKLLERVGMKFEKSLERFDANQSIYAITRHQYV